MARPIKIKRDPKVERLAAQLKAGDKVDYHDIIDGPVTQANVTLRSDPFKSCCDDWVVFLEGRSGYVALEAVTPVVVVKGVAK